MPINPHHTLDHLVRYLQNQFRSPYAVEVFFYYLKTLSQSPVPPSLLLDRSKNGNTPQRTLHIRSMCRGLPWDAEDRTCGGEGLEDFKPGVSGGTHEGEYGGREGGTTRGHGLT